MDNLTFGVICGGMFACGMLLYKFLYDDTKFYERKLGELRVENAKLSRKLKRIKQALESEV